MTQPWESEANKLESQARLLRKSKPEEASLQYQRAAEAYLTNAAGHEDRLQKSLRLLEQADGFAPKGGGKKRVLMHASANHELAKTYSQRGDYAAAEQSIDKALRSVKAPFLLVQRGSIYRAQNKLDAAQRDLSDALRAGQLTLPNRFTAREQLALVLYDLRKFKAAESEFLKGLKLLEAIRRRRPGGNAIQEELYWAQFLHNFARMYYEWSLDDKANSAEKKRKAMPRFNQAWELRWAVDQKTKDKSVPDFIRLQLDASIADSSYNFAMIHFDDYEKNKSEASLVECEKWVAEMVRRIEAMGRRAPRDMEYNARYFQAKLDCERGRSEEAFEHVTSAIQLAKEQRRFTAGTPFDRSKTFQTMMTACERKLEWCVKSDQPELVFMTMEECRGQGFVEDLAMDKTKYREALQNVYLPARNALQIDPEDWLYDEEGDSNALEQPLRAFRQIRQSLFSNEDRLEEGGQDWKGLLDWADREDALVLEYFVGPNRAFLLALCGAGEKSWQRVFPLQLDAAQAKKWGVSQGALTSEVLNDVLNQPNAGVLHLLQQELENDKSDLRSKQKAKSDGSLQQLAELLLPKEIQRVLISGRLKRLLIVPDGLLAQVPFEALRLRRENEQNIYVIECGAPTTYAPSAHVFLLLVARSQRILQREATERKPVLSMSKRVFPYHHERWSTELTGAEQQAKNCVRQLGPAKAELLANPTESLFCKSVTNRSLIFVATHAAGTDQFENIYGSVKLEVGVRQEKDARDDGRLEIPEVHALNLEGCQLVALTACQTNIGPSLTGEFPWGFSRAFIAAGANRVVAGNWQVGDGPTYIVVAGFTGKIVEQLTANGEDFAKVDYVRALHKAKLGLIDEPPQYWAGLVHIGP